MNRIFKSENSSPIGITLRLAATLLPTFFLIAMVAWPVVALVKTSFEGADAKSLLASLTDTSLLKVYWFTFYQAALSACLTLVAGLPIAHALAKYQFRLNTALRAIVIVPFVLPTVVVASAFDEVFKTFNIEAKNTIWAVLLAHAFFNISVVVRLVGGYWSRLDPNHSDTATMLGASPVKQFWLVALPQLRPAIFGAVLITFLFSFTSFGIARILGGLKFATLEIEIYRYAISLQQFDTASLLSIVQIATVAILATTAAYFQRKAATVQRNAKRLIRPMKPKQKLYLLAVGGWAAFAIGLPMLILTASSFRQSAGYGLDNYFNLFERVEFLPTPAIQTLANSMLFATIASLIATFLGVATALAVFKSRRSFSFLEVLSILPLGISAVTLGLGYIVGFAVLDLRQQIWLIPVAHAVIGYPFVVAAVLPALRSIDPALRDASATLGASKFSILRRIDWPLTATAIASGAGFAAAVSLGEFGATSFLSRGDSSYTAPLAIFRLLSTPGDTLRGQALALCVLIGVCVASLSWLIEKGRKNQISAL